MDRQMADYLQGGKLLDPSEELKEQTKSCVSSNISERQFTKMKVIQQKYSNVTMARIEARKIFDLVDLCPFWDLFLLPVIQENQLYSIVTSMNYYRTAVALN